MEQKPTPGNETLLKVAHNQTEYIKALESKNAELSSDCVKLADGVTELSNTNAELQKDNETLAEAVGEKLEGLAETATSPATADSISDGAKDALVEAVAKVDGDVADDLANAIDDAAEKGELNGEKMATLAANAVSTIAAKYASQNLGREIGNLPPTSGGFGKQAGSRGAVADGQNPWVARAAKTLQTLSKNQTNGKR